MSATMIQEMNEVTFYNDETNTWSYYGSERADFDTQLDAYEDYLAKMN